MSRLGAGEIRLGRVKSIRGWMKSRCDEIRLTAGCVWMWGVSSVGNGLIRSGNRVRRAINNRPYERDGAVGNGFIRSASGCVTECINAFPTKGVVIRNI